MLTYSDWETLPELKQLEQISALLLTCGYNKRTNYIYRPIKMIPDMFIKFKCDILKIYPNGEKTTLLDEYTNYDKYQFLYYWITGGCTKCNNHSLVWDIDNNSLLYYCRYCGDKTLVYTISEL